MGFRDNAYCRIFSFTMNETGKSGTASISISKKKPDGNYEKDFSDYYTRIVGTALTQLRGKNIPEKGLSARILACETTGAYDKENKKQNYHHTVFSFAFEGDEAYEFKSNGGGNKRASAPKPAATPPRQEPKPKVQDNEQTWDEEDFPF